MDPRPGPGGVWLAARKPTAGWSGHDDDELVHCQGHLMDLNCYSLLLGLGGLLGS